MSIPLLLKHLAGPNTPMSSERILRSDEYAQIDNYKRDSKHRIKLVSADKITMQRSDTPN